MGNLRLHYQRCIHDSSFNGDIEDIESNSEVEKETFKIIEKGIEKCDSFITDIGPLKKSPRKQD